MDNAFWDDPFWADVAKESRAASLVLPPESHDQLPPVPGEANPSRVRSTRKDLNIKKPAATLPPKIRDALDALESWPSYNNCLSCHINKTTCTRAFDDDNPDATPPSGRHCPPWLSEEYQCTPFMQGLSEVLWSMSQRMPRKQLQNDSASNNKAALDPAWVLHHFKDGTTASDVEQGLDLFNAQAERSSETLRRIIKHVQEGQRWAHRGADEESQSAKLSIPEIVRALSERGAGVSEQDRNDYASAMLEQHAHRSLIQMVDAAREIRQRELGIPLQGYNDDRALSVPWDAADASRQSGEGSGQSLDETAGTADLTPTDVAMLRNLRLEPSVDSCMYHTITKSLCTFPEDGASGDACTPWMEALAAIAWQQDGCLRRQKPSKPIRTSSSIPCCTGDAQVRTYSSDKGERIAFARAAKRYRNSIVSLLPALSWAVFTYRKLERAEIHAASNAELGVASIRKVGVPRRDISILQALHEIESGDTRVLSEIAKLWRTTRDGNQDADTGFTEILQEELDNTRASATEAPTILLDPADDGPTRVGPVRRSRSRSNSRRAEPYSASSAPSSRATSPVPSGSSLGDEYAMDDGSWGSRRLSSSGPWLDPSVLP